MHTWYLFRRARCPTGYTQLKAICRLVARKRCCRVLRSGAFATKRYGGTLGVKGGGGGGVKGYFSRPLTLAPAWYGRHRVRRPRPSR